MREIQAAAIEQAVYDLILEASYNIGPDDCDCAATGELVDIFCKAWGDGASWKNVSEANAPHEANFLKLDCSKLKATFGWKPRWNLDNAIEKVVEWTKCWKYNHDIRECMDRQIASYLEAKVIKK